MGDSLLISMTRFTEFDKDEYDQILSHFTSLSVPAKTVLDKLDQIPSSVYFIKKGSIRCYCLSDIEEINIGFYFENSFVGSMSSFFEKTPSKQVIETLEDCELLCLGRHNYERLNNIIPRMNIFSRRLLEQMWIKNDELAIALMLSSFEDRFNVMIKQQPELLSRVPIAYLASYFDIPLRYVSKLVEDQGTF